MAAAIPNGHVARALLVCAMLAMVMAAEKAPSYRRHLEYMTDNTRNVDPWEGRDTEAKPPCTVYNFQGYQFYQDRDQYGYDIGRASTMWEAKNKCDASSSCRGFNVHSWYKNRAVVSELKGAGGYESAGYCGGIYIKQSTGK